MANLTGPSPRTYEVNADPNELDYPQGSEQTWEGSALTDAGSPGSGTNVAHTLIAGENFLGFANTSQNNASGTAFSTINVKGKGCAKLTVTGVTAASIGASVYASDGNTFTLTSTSNTRIGTVKQIISGTLCLVQFAGVGFKVG